MRVKMSKPPPPAPIASAIGPCPTVIKIVGASYNFDYSRAREGERLTRQVNQKPMSKAICIEIGSKNDNNNNRKSNVWHRKRNYYFSLRLVLEYKNVSFTVSLRCWSIPFSEKR